MLRVDLKKSKDFKCGRVIFVKGDRDKYTVREFTVDFKYHLWMFRNLLCLAVLEMANFRFFPLFKPFFYLSTSSFI